MGLRRMFGTLSEISSCIDYSQYDPETQELTIGPFFGEEDCAKCVSSSSSSEEGSSSSEEGSSSSEEGSSSSEEGSSSSEGPPPTFPCVDCPETPTTDTGGNRQLLDLPCCPQGPGGGGDIHMFWSGPSGAKGAITNNIVFFDDNIILGSLAQGQNSRIDHYAVEWFEVHKDGSFAAILSERKILCMWPYTNVAARVMTIGSPAGCTVTSSCSNIKTPTACKECVLDEPWCRLNFNINFQNLATMQSFGGIHWEGMRYIASNESSVTPSGFTGPIGNGATFFSGFRLFNSSPSLQDITSSGPSYSVAEAIDTVQKLIDLSARINSWEDIDLSKTIDQRLQALAATSRTPSPGEPKCCHAIDIDYLDGEPCCELTERGGIYAGLKVCQIIGSIQTITNDFEYDALLTITGSVDDDVIIDGQIYEEGKYGFPWDAVDNPCGSKSGDNGAHEFTYTKVLAPGESVTIGAKDNCCGGGINATWTLQIQCDPPGSTPSP
jgi:hypothetical protein